jgi:hypothetical protein
MASNLVHAALFAAAIALPGCGSPSNRATGASSSVAPASTTSTAAYPDDGRLHRPYQTEEYRYTGASASMGSWRMDVAPAGVSPRLSRDAAIAMYNASPDGGITRQSGTTTRAFFGLFSGNAPNPSAPDGRLTGTHPIGPVPAWLFLVEGLELAPTGQGVAGGGPLVPGAQPTTTNASTTTSALPTSAGYAVAVLSDPDGRLLTGLQESGSGAGSTGIE